MKENFQGLSVGGHDDQVSDASVEGLGGFVGALLQLFVVRSLLNQVKNSDSQLGVSEGICFGIYFGHLQKIVVLGGEID